jgi:nucleoside-diphosphate-sugar epimerase
MSANASMTVAITGASGMIGRALCAHLGSRGFHVRALARRPDAALEVMPNVTTFRCELPDAIPREALAGCQALIHGAYVTRFRSIDEARRINETGTQRLLEASRGSGVPRFVFISSLSAHSAARSYYGQSKFRLESLLDPQRDLAIRPGLVLADSGGLFGRLRGRPGRTMIVPLFGDGRQPVQTIHIDDLCQGFLLVLRQGCAGTLTLAEPNATPMREFLALVAARLQNRIRFVRAPIRPSLTALRLCERLGLRLPVSSENLLGLLSAVPVNPTPDLQRLGLRVRPLRESLASLALA